MPGIPQSYSGRGSALQAALDGAAWTSVAQLQSLRPSGSKLSLVDATSIGSLGYRRLAPGVLDGGDFSFAGIRPPASAGSASLLTLEALHGARLEAWFRLALPDGAMLAWQGFVSEFAWAEVSVKKAVEFSGKLAVDGPVYDSALCAFDPGGFDLRAFQCGAF
jgi:hypothetical protein